MATILFTWELGAGTGHLARFRDLAVHLHERGHRVVFAVRDVARAGKVYGNVAAEVLSAPSKVGRPSCAIEPTAAYPQILHNFGYEHPGELLALLKAWRSLYAYVAPDLVVLDHSPTALLALRDMGLPRVLAGTGFVIPPERLPHARAPAGHLQRRGGPTPRRGGTGRGEPGPGGSRGAAPRSPGATVLPSRGDLAYDLP